MPKLPLFGTGWRPLMADDFSELHKLAADLGQAPASMSIYLLKALQRTAYDVKKDAQNSVRQRNGLAHAANGITYETMEDRLGASAEIGYDKNRSAGKLGNLIEFGAPNAKKHILVNGRNVPVGAGDIPRPLPPSHDLGNALMKNAEDFERGVFAAADDALKEGGL